MSHFVTRVELHNATWSDYQKLHAVMENQGYSRVILGDDGVWYDLPTATYHLKSDRLTLTEVRKLANDAAASIGKKYCVLTQAGDVCWQGLAVAVSPVIREILSRYAR